jgi:hypothetical protein
VHGAAPKDLAPVLYQTARYKKRSVYDELKNSSWIKNLQEIHDPDLLDEFVQLYMARQPFSYLITKTTLHGSGLPMGSFQSN